MEHLKVPKEWFLNRCLIVGMRRFDFTDPYFVVMNTKDVRDNLIVSQERDCYILEATLLVLS